MFSLRKLEGATKKARLNELRKHPRLVVGCRVDATWEADGETRQTSGRCLDISVGGARIEVFDKIPVASSVHLRFRDNLNFEADGLVCHSDEQNSVGVEFTRMMFCGSLVRRKRRTLLGRARMPLEVISGLVLLVILLLVLQRDWRLFSSKSVSQPMPLTAPSFSLGSTKADVQAAQGSPTRMADSVWNYGPSKVHFRDGRVVGWLASPGSPLNVGENRVESAKTKRDSFTMGSTATGVLAVQGSPTELTETVWRYGQSEVYFRKGRVTGWKNSPTHPLKFRALQDGQRP